MPMMLMLKVNRFARLEKQTAIELCSPLFLQPTLLLLSYRHGQCNCVFHVPDAPTISMFSGCCNASFTDCHNWHPCPPAIPPLSPPPQVFALSAVTRSIISPPAAIDLARCFIVAPHCGRHRCHCPKGGGCVKRRDGDMTPLALQPAKQALRHAAGELTPLIIYNDREGQCGGKLNR